MQIDTIAELETTALLEGLHDEELRRDPKFLATVRKYLKDNELYTTKKPYRNRGTRGKRNTHF